MKKGTKMGAIAHALKRKELIFSEYLFLFCSLVVYNGRIVAGEYELVTRHVDVSDSEKDGPWREKGLHAENRRGL